MIVTKPNVQSSLMIEDVSIWPIFEEGYVVKIGLAKYAIHRNICLACLLKMTLYLNEEYSNRFTESDLEIIKYLDNSFKKEENIFSSLYEIKTISFKKKGEDDERE